MAETPLLASSLFAFLKFGPGLSPSGHIIWRQVQAFFGALPCRHAGEEPRRPFDYQSRRSAFAAAGTTLLVTITAEEMLQVVVCPRDVRRLIAAKQSCPVALGYLHEVQQLLADRFGPGLLRCLTHLRQDLRQ